ncbi:hypothetical protein I4U23_024679 [Adineta vaga]|nr:hypothetical protein I4U23_024679 [Adineta vaga]
MLPLILIVGFMFINSKHCIDDFMKDSSFALGKHANTIAVLHKAYLFRTLLLVLNTGICVLLIIESKLGKTDSKLISEMTVGVDIQNVTVIFRKKDRTRLMNPISEETDEMMEDPTSFQCTIDPTNSSISLSEPSAQTRYSMDNKHTSMNLSSESHQTNPQWFFYSPVIVIPGWISYFMLMLIFLKSTIDLNYSTNYSLRIIGYILPIIILIKIVWIFILLIQYSIYVS